MTIDDRSYEECQSPATLHSEWARLAVITAMIGIVALTRLLPHPPNLTAAGAMSLFGGACLANRRTALALSMVAMLLTDLVLGFGLLSPVVYGSLALNVLLGRWVRNRRLLLPIAGATLLGSLQFFLITNLPCWWLWYPRTLSGLSECFVAAAPFFQNTLLGDAIYSLALFGGLAAVERSVPAVREVSAAAA